MKLKLLSIQLLSLLMVVGCANETASFIDPEEGKGVPVISRIIDANTLEEVTETVLEQNLIIEGKHLTSVTKILVNDVELRIGYAAQVVKNRVYVRIPYTKPSAINDKLVLANEHGTTEKGLKVSVPELIIGSLDNEFALPGEVVTLSGSYFDLYGVVKGKKVLVGSAEAVIMEATKTSVKFAIPAGAADNSVITLKGTADYRVHSKYRSTENIIDNFEAGKGSERTAWIVPNTTYPAPLTPAPSQGERYCRFTKSVGSWGWNDVQSISFAYTPDMLLNADKWVIKMEVNTVRPLNGGGIKVGLSSSDFVYLWGDGSKTLSASESLDTKGKWQTVTLPFDFAKNKSGSRFVMITHSGIVGTTNWNYDFCVDNIRIEKLP